jgi:hypothetical protein
MGVIEGLASFSGMSDFSALSVSVSLLIALFGTLGNGKDLGSLKPLG